MLIVPRSYQNECVTSLYGYFETKSGNPVCALPTGTGKSVVIAMFLESIFKQWQNQKVLVLTHVKELIQQNYMKLIALWPGAPAGINSAGLGKRDIHERIIFAGIASVAKLFAVFGHVDLIIIDECHLVSPNDETMYRAFINGLKSMNPRLKVIGFTATPWRLGHGKITEEGALFTDVCFDITGMEPFNRLIAEGYLAPLVPKRTALTLDVEGVHMRGSEFIANELQAAVDKDELTRRALSEAVEKGHDRHKWLIFAAGVHHALRVSEILEAEFGIQCPAVHSDLASGQRDKFISDFRNGRVRAVVNNNVLTTGLDVPDIDLILMLRPTASPVLWVQMLGRGTRPVYAPGFDLNDMGQRLEAIAASQKQDCLVLDFAGNTKRLGPINDPVIPHKKGKKGGTAPVKLCEMCDTWNHARASKCAHCGAEFVIDIKLKTEASTHELIKGDLPVVEVFRVEHVTYSLHQKDGKPDAMKVTYYCGPRSFNEYVCLDHDGYAGRKARMWWRERTNNPVPSRTDEPFKLASHYALEQAEHLKPATHLRVWINKKYPEIMSFCFDGTGFVAGASVQAEAPSVDVRGRRPTVNPVVASEIRAAQRSETYSSDVDSFDDDIPF